MKVLILKLSDKDLDIPFGNEAALIKRANGAWRITPQKLGSIEKAFLLFRGQIINEYFINPIITYDRGKKRITFDMKLIEKSQFKNKFLAYRTANPASTIKEDDFKSKLSDIHPKLQGRSKVVDKKG